MRVALLGPLEVIDDAGRRRAVAGARLRVLLAALALRANEPVSRDALTDAIWNGAPPPGNAATLRNHVKRLRESVGPQGAARIVTRTPGYMLELTEGELDLAEFEALCGEVGTALRAAAWERAMHAADRALGLWRGETLSDVPSQVLRDACVPQLERLREQLHEDRIEAQIRLGHYEHALTELRDLTAHYPLRERLHAWLMLALAGSGRRAEALEAYQSARKVLVGELGIEPGRELRAAHERILGGDEPSSASRTDSVPRGAPAPQMPWQLPAAERRFTGRAAELNALIGAAQRAHGAGGAGAVCTIGGTAGIGKTALAVYAAHRLAEEFPDGQLFVDMHGHTQTGPPRSPDAALDWLLRALGTPSSQMPDEPEARVALYRRCLAGTRTLIVVDDALDEAQVRPLLPGVPGCLVLITNRERLDGLEDADCLWLDPFSAEDAITLLRGEAGVGRVPRDDPLPVQVAQLCGYSPLTLRIIGALLRHRPAWSLEHLIDRLRDQHRRRARMSGREPDLGAVLTLSYDCLPEQDRMLFRRLGMVPGLDADAYAAAALLEGDPETLTGLLEGLVDRNLLIAFAPGRYRLHDLIRAHARSLAVTDYDHVGALDRLLHYYAHAAHNASISLARYPRPAPDGPPPGYCPTPSDPVAARVWLRAERENLEAAHTLARTSALHGHAVAIAAGLAEIMMVDGPPTHALEMHQAAADIAVRLAHPAAYAAALADLGRARYLIGDCSRAGDAYICALEIYRELGDRDGEAYVLTELGRIRTLTGDYFGAGDVLARALELSRVLGRRENEATALAELGRVQYLTGDFCGARGALARALELSHVLGHREGEATALADLGRVGYLTGDFSGADDALARSQEIYRGLGNHRGEATALIDLGRVRYLTGDFSSAGAVLARSLEIYRALGNRRGEAYALTELGRIRTLTGDCSGAGEAYTGALEIYRGLGDRSYEAWALTHYATTLSATGQRPRALALYRQALAMNRELDKFDDEAITLECLGECEVTVGDTSDGIAYLRQALEMYQRLGMAPDTDRVRLRLAALATA